MFGGRIASIQDFFCISLNALDPSAQPRHIFFLPKIYFRCKHALPRAMSSRSSGDMRLLLLVIA